MNNEHTDLYDVLGLTPDATPDEIRRAYKTMAFKYHPDKNKQPGAEDRFKKITYANEILSNPEKKDIYDRYGEEGLNSGFGDNDMDPMAELLRKMHQPQRNPVMQMPYEISLEEYFTKKFVTIPVHRDIRCESCDGTGFSDGKPHLCAQCNGTGLVIKILQQGPMIQQIQTKCHLCRGTKYDLKTTAARCINCVNGTIKTTDEVDAEIPADIIRRPMTIIPEKGPWVENKYIDLAVIFKLRMPKEFGITNDKRLVSTMHINYPETVCGFRRVIDHPSGKKILVVAEKGYVINPDNIYFFDKLGFNGDVMCLLFVIHYPDTITLPKRKPLTYESLEFAFGDRRVPNIDDNSEIDPENIYTLSTLSKINNNPRKESMHADNSESDEEGPTRMPGCAQQ